MALIPLGIMAASGVGAGGDFELLQTIDLSGQSTYIDFTGINTYSGYKHLHIRALTRSVTGTTGDLRFLFNYDPSALYAYSFLWGFSSINEIRSIGSSSVNEGRAGKRAGSNEPSGIFGVSVIDILDFNSTSKNKTLRAMGGVGSGDADPLFVTSSYNSTNPITSITFGDGSNAFSAGSRISIYGVKG